MEKAKEAKEDGIFTFVKTKAKIKSNNFFQFYLLILTKLFLFMCI